MGFEALESSSICAQSGIITNIEINIIFTMMKENINNNKNLSSNFVKCPKKPIDNPILNPISLNASRDRMSELFNDFKKLNIDESTKNISSSVPTPSIINELNHFSKNGSTSSSNGSLSHKNTSLTTVTTINTTSVPGSANSIANVSSVTDTLDQLKGKTYTESKLDHSTLSNSTTTLYVGDLDLGFTEAALYKLFEKYNSLLSVKLCLNPATKLSLGYGYVNFSDESDAQSAIEDLNYTLVSNKEIRIMPYMKGKNKPFMSTNVFISNLNDQDLTLRLFYEKFKHFGTVLSCKLDLKKKQGFISFKDKETAETFVRTYNSSVVDGSKLHCSIHIPKSLRRLSFPEQADDYTKRAASLPLPPVLNRNITEESLETTVHMPVENPQLNQQSKAVSSETPKVDSSVSKFTQIYVKGLPVNVTDEEIKDLFGPYGTISELYKESVPTFKSSWCFVTFENASSAANAVATCHKITYKGRKITCVKALKKSERQPKSHINEPSSLPLKPTISSAELLEASQPTKLKTTKLYIYNLPQSVNENFFKLFLKHYKLEGNAVKFSFTRGSRDNYIEFEKKSDAKIIHQKLNGVSLYGLVLQTSLSKLDFENTAASVSTLSTIDGKSDMSSIASKDGHSILKSFKRGESKVAGSTNFHPIGHHQHLHFIDTPVSPSPVPLNNYLIPSLSSFSSLNPSLPSGSTNITSAASTSSTPPVIQNINGTHYKLVPISNPPSVNEHSLDVHSAYILSKQGNSPLCYLDFYTTGIESEPNEKLYADLEKLALRHIDFLKYPSATRPRNLKKILNYLVVTLWDNKLDEIQIAINMTDKDQELGRVFKERLIGAIKLFGFER